MTLSDELPYIVYIYQFYVCHLEMWQRSKQIFKKMVSMQRRRCKSSEWMWLFAVRTCIRIYFIHWTTKCPVLLWMQLVITVMVWNGKSGKINSRNRFLSKCYWFMIIRLLFWTHSNSSINEANPVWCANTEYSDIYCVFYCLSTGIERTHVKQ